MGSLSERLAKLCALIAVASLNCACAELPAPGEYGTFRYVGQVRGSAPLNVLPPISDRAGNAYVLYGALDLINEAQLFIGHAGGGWSGGCALTYGNDYGAHGFIGRAQERAWYWSGEALVSASGRTGGCARILEFDLASGARLNFRAVVPWVRETPLSTTALAWIQSPTDPVPYQVVLDLNVNVYTSIRVFEPSDATEIEVLGVGGYLPDREGLVIVRYRRGNSLRVEARYIDGDGNTTDQVALSGLDTLPAYGIVGYMQRNDGGLYAGLDSEGQMIVLDRSGGQRRAVNGLSAVGVHRWEGELWLVGTNGGQPVVSRIDDDGDQRQAQVWEASLEAAQGLSGSISVVDDRSLPSSTTTWQSPKSAMGEFPFLHAHRLDAFAEQTTNWLVAGPSFVFGGGEDRTAIAYVPVGVTYP